MVCSVPVAATSVNNNAGDMGSGSDAIRFLNASGPLLTPGGIAGFSHPMEHEAAFRAAMAQGALPFPAIYPGLHPAVSFRNNINSHFSVTTAASNT